MGVFIIVIISVCYPLINTKILAPGDGPYHLLRIEGIKEGMLAGNFPVKIYPNFMNGYGYGSGLFYADVFLYIPAIFRMIGISPQISYKLFLLLCMMATYITTYLATKSISKNKYMGMCSAILICLCQYYLYNLFVRAALGKIQAYIFFPLIIWGVYDLIFEDFNKPYVIGIGFLGLMFSHTISLVIALIVVFLLVLLNLKNIITKPKKLRKLIIVAIVVLLASCAFWAPLLEQMFSGKFNFSNPWTRVSENSIFPLALFKQTGTGIGTTIVVLCFFRLNPIKNESNRENINKIDWFLINGVICVIVTTKLFPWK